MGWELAAQGLPRYFYSVGHDTETGGISQNEVGVQPGTANPARGSLSRGTRKSFIFYCLAIVKGKISLLRQVHPQAKPILELRKPLLRVENKPDNR